MLKLNCSCGSENFNVSRTKTFTRCSSCFKKFEFKEGSWIEYKFSLKKLLNLKFISEIYNFKKGKAIVEDEIESTGSWLKRHGITRERKTKLVIFNEKLKVKSNKLSDDAIKKASLMTKWTPVISELNVKGFVSFNRNQHFGKLRGRDVAKIAHRDLRLIGYPTRLSFTDNFGAVLFKINEKEGT